MWCANNDDPDPEEPLTTFFLSGIGLNPIVRNTIAKLDWCKRCAYQPKGKKDDTGDDGDKCCDNFNALLALFIFAVDLTDTIIDFVLGARSAYYGSSVSEQGAFGIVLVFMTFLGRNVAGIYGVTMEKEFRHKEEKIGDTINLFGYSLQTFLLILLELSIFIVEDGAAILLVAITPENDRNIWEFISMILTVICAFIFVLGGLISLCKCIQKLMQLSSGWCCLVSYSVRVLIIALILLILLVGFVLFVFILIKHVFLSNEEPLSGTIKVLAIIVYGIESLVVIVCSFMVYYKIGRVDRTLRALYNLPRPLIIDVTGY